MLTAYKVYAVLPSSDLDRARAWYEEKTGTTPSMSDPGGLWYECAEGTWFLVTRSAFAGTAQNTAASFQVTGIEQVMADMRERGVVFEDYDLPDFKTEDGLFTHGPYRAAWFKDADGNIIEISEVLGE
jgi:catechol 2,3-dioxygenase-like lactoylglutathione lyase family enzyme